MAKDRPLRDSLLAGYEFITDLAGLTVQYLVDQAYHTRVIKRLADDIHRQTAVERVIRLRHADEQASL